MVSLIAKETNLYKYTNSIYYKNCNRDILFNLCLQSIIDNNNLTDIKNIYYIDDRLDHLKLIYELNNKTIK